MTREDRTSIVHINRVRLERHPTCLEFSIIAVADKTPVATMTQAAGTQGVHIA
jgi:hypothetical protein